MAEEIIEKSQNVEQPPINEAESVKINEDNTQTEIIDNFANAVEEYSTQAPDFAQAFNYLIELRDKQLTQYSSLYPELNDIKNRNQQIENEALEIIKMAQQSGNNAPDFMYNLAKNLGYKTEEAKPILAQNEEVKKSARTLTASNGGIANSPMTIEGLASLSQEEFDAWYWRNKQEFKRIMGR